MKYFRKTVYLTFTVISLIACKTSNQKDDSVIVQSESEITDTLNVHRDKKIKERLPDPLCFKIRNEHIGYDSLFFEVCKDCDSLLIKQFIDSNIDLNKKDNLGNTALMYVVAQPVESGNYDIVRLFIDSGAELNHVNLEGKTALTLARTYFNENGHGSDDSKNNCQIVKLLKENGALEYDYIDYLLKNLSGVHKKEQSVVMNIKKKFNEFNTEKSNLILREIKNDSDIIHRAYFSHQDSLKYYYNKYHYEIHYHDGDADNLTEKHYYFDNGFLYFHFEEFEDFLMKDKRQVRAYYSHDSLVVLSVKDLDTWRKCTNTENVNDLINVKSYKRYYKYQNIMSKFEEDVKFVKDSLKILK